MIYLLDSNIFIQAHRAYYPLDVVLSFWETIKELANQGVIYTINYVKNEIYRNEDELKNWCENNLPSEFFINADEEIFPNNTYVDVINWAVSKIKNPYSEKAVNQFSSTEVADSFLIAYALVDIDERVIITQETPAPNAKHRIKIPDVCNAFNIRYMNIMDMFRELKVTF